MEDTKDRTADTNRVSRICVRLRPSERAYLEYESERLGITITEYVRGKILGEPVVSRVDREALSELRRQGGLLKYFHSETGGLHSDITKAILEDIGATVRAIKESAG